MDLSKADEHPEPSSSSSIAHPAWGDGPRGQSLTGIDGDTAVHSSGDAAAGVGAACPQNDSAAPQAG